MTTTKHVRLHWELLEHFNYKTKAPTTLMRPSLAALLLFKMNLFNKRAEFISLMLFVKLKAEFLILKYPTAPTVQ